MDLDFEIMISKMSQNAKRKKNAIVFRRKVETILSYLIEKHSTRHDGRNE